MLRVIFISAILCISSIGLLHSADTSDASAALESFRIQASSGHLNASAYNSLYRAFEGYVAAAKSAPADSPAMAEYHKALAEIFPALADAAYYYAALGDQETVLKFACAFVDVSLVPCMYADGCRFNQHYSVLTNLAATNLYNRRKYAQSITYFQAYLESNDMTSRELAFEGLARCHFETKDYGSAASIAYQGIKLYPSNWNLLLIGIEACGHNGNDPEMDVMLDKALALQPNHPGLLEYKGKLQERQKKYLQAAGTFGRLSVIEPANLDHLLHEGFNYYNAAVMARRNGDSSSTTLFRQAAPLLKTVLDNKPYAANVARALAFCYSLTNDARRLEETNRSLMALHAPTVDFSSLPQMERGYDARRESDPVGTMMASTSNGLQNNDFDDEPVSDIDINIPETGLQRRNTYVLIIANEHYANIDNNDVKFAHRDGESFETYCRKVLGVPADNIFFKKDATLATMGQAIDKLDKITRISPEKFDVIFYYAGHGQPRLSKPGSGESFLIPADGSVNETYWYGLDKLYSQFNEMPAKTVTVFLDACFSGASPNGGSLFSARAVQMEAADITPPQKVVAFSAASSTERSLPYNKQRHGFFTYHLLKVLQQTRGRISLQQLADRLREEVPLATAKVMELQQTPTVQWPADASRMHMSRTLLD